MDQKVVKADQVRVSEIFYSLQGEARSAGCPTVFIRLSGCPLRCAYCDTEYAFRDGKWMSYDAVEEAVREYGDLKYVCVTGGEPLAQATCEPLLTRLCDAGYMVSLETSGAMNIADVDDRVRIVMDLKTPSSGELDRNLYSNIEYLRRKDQVKFVIADRADYDWSKSVMNEYALASRSEILMSPVHGKIQPAQLAEWILEDRLPVRLQLQLHKLLWGDERGR